MFGYGVGNLGFGIIFQMIAVYLIFYTTAVLNIPGTLIGTAVAISVLWDAFSDLIMGYISDGNPIGRLGRRHPYLLMGSFSAAFLNLILWQISPDLSTNIKFTLVFFLIILVKSALTVYIAPYNALGAELSDDYHERTSIQSIKTVFFLIGLFSATVAGMAYFFRPTLQYPLGQLNPEAYSRMGITASILMVFCGLLCFFSTKKHIPHLPKSRIKEKKRQGEMLNIFTVFLSALKNKDYLYVIIGYLFTNISSALVGTIGLHVFTYTFQLDNRGIALVIGVQFFVSIISQPLWVIISNKIDKKPSVIAALMLSIAACIIFIGLVFYKDMILGSPVYILPFAILIGFGTGGLFSLPQSMVADTLDIEELETGISPAGIYYGALTLFYKLSQAIAIFILGMVLDWVNFNPEVVIQEDSTVITLGLILSIGSLISFLFALFFYSKYSLNKGKIEKVHAQILMNKTSRSTT